MKLKELHEILRSKSRYIQFAIVYDTKKNADVESGCSIDYVLEKYENTEVKHIEAFENQLVLYI